MDPLSGVNTNDWKGTPESSPRGERKRLKPRVLFPDETSSSGGGDEGIPFWKKGLAVVGAIALFWAFLKDPLVKWVTTIKEKYGID